jgi:hypothetical protein
VRAASSFWLSDGTGEVDWDDSRWLMLRLEIQLRQWGVLLIMRA